MPDRITNGPFAFHTDVWPGVAKLMEECGETVQILAKLLMIGGGRDHFDGSDLCRRLEEEVADLEAALIFFRQHNKDKISLMAVDYRTSKKLDLFNKWHAEGEE